MRTARLTLLVSAALLLAGCGGLFATLARVRPRGHTASWHKKDRLAKRMSVADEEYLVLASGYARRIEERKGKEPEKHTRAKYQPLQLRWYSGGGRAQWIIPNCDAGGFPNLQWKRFGLPDTLFALQPSRAYTDSAWTLSDDLAYTVERRTGRTPEKPEGARGHLLVYWTYFMGRQSVRLARQVERWRQRHGDGIAVRYVNAGTLLFGADKPEAAPQP